MMSSNLPIIDSHIHLYAEAHLSELNWTAGLLSDHILNQQSSLAQYRVATRHNKKLLGFVFLETDRKCTLDELGWKHPLEEVAFLARVARGHPLEGEGHAPEDSELVLGIVPWAPIPAGPKELEQYYSKVRQVCGDQRTLSLVKGFRYLLQDKPAGTMLRLNFIAGLRWLGDHNLCFDLGVDLRQGGSKQLFEACSMLKLVYNKGNNLKVIINHFCKPNMRAVADKAVDLNDSEHFVAWSKCIRQLASHPTTYMKLSGFFSELPPQTEDHPTPLSELVGQVRPWITVVFQAFGPSRIMFGSDWPVCSAGGPGSKAWQHWVDLVTTILEDQKLTHEDKLRVWSGTAVEAYGIMLGQ